MLKQWVDGHLSLVWLEMAIASHLRGKDCDKVAGHDPDQTNHALTQPNVGETMMPKFGGN